MNSYIWVPTSFPSFFDILVKFRSHTVAITADIEKVFLTIGIVPED